MWYDLYELAVFQTTVTATTWDEDEQTWNVATDRGDHMKARFVICANGTLCKPKLAKISGMESYSGHSFHTSRWDYEYTKPDLSGLRDKVVGIIGTGASAVQAVPRLGEAAKELYVFQRTPSSVDIKNDWPTDPNWARKLTPGWQARRRAAALKEPELSPEQKEKIASLSREEKIRRQENPNIDAMMRIHRRIDEIVKDPETADALKPWYMLMCKRPCSRSQDCTPGYYNFEGEFQRRQDGNYNGSYPQYLAHVKDVGANIEENFVFTKR